MLQSKWVFCLLYFNRVNGCEINGFYEVCLQTRILYKNSNKLLITYYLKILRIYSRNGILAIFNYGKDKQI